MYSLELVNLNADLAAYCGMMARLHAELLLPLGRAARQMPIHINLLYWMNYVTKLTVDGQVTAIKTPRRIMCTCIIT
jgi:hypothetical protein